MSNKIENAREKLMKTGKQCLLEGKDSDFSVKEVAAQCGMATGTFYQYFPSKEALIFNILQKDWEELLTSFDEIKEEEISLHEKINFVFNGLAGFETNYRNSPAVALALRKEYAEIRRDNLQRMYRVLEKLVRIEVSRGHLVLCGDAGRTALLMTQLFLAVGRNTDMPYDHVAECLRFHDNNPQAIFEAEGMDA